MELIEDEIRKTAGGDPKKGAADLLRILSSELAYHKEYEIGRLVDRLLDGLERPAVFSGERMLNYKEDLYLVTSQLHKAADSREWEDVTEAVRALSLYLSHLDQRAEAAADRLYTVLIGKQMRAPKGPT